MSSSMLQVAVVGLGFGHLHCRTISETKGLKLAALCDEDPKRLAAAVAQFGARPYSSFQELLQDKSLDLVVLVVPTHRHLPMALEAMKAGKHVVVEKPMCLNPKEAALMLKARDKHRVMLSVHQNRRFDGDFLSLQAAIRRGLIGKAFLFEARVQFYGPWGGWRLHRRFGGGILFDWGAHLVDQLLLLNPGAKVRSVYANLLYKVFGTEVENFASVRLNFSNGNLGLAEIGQLEALPLPRWNVLGEKGSLLLDTRKWPNEAKSRFEWHRREAKQNRFGQIALMKSKWKEYYENVAAHLMRGKRLEVQPEQTARGIAILHAALRSSEAGKEIKVE